MLTIARDLRMRAAAGRFYKGRMMNLKLRLPRVLGIVLAASSLGALGAAPSPDAPTGAAAQAAAALPSFDKLPERAEPPDPLKMLDGTPVTTSEQWKTKRRPELKALFQHYMYGYMPEAPGITAELKRQDAVALGGKATLKQIEIRIKGLPENAPRIHLALFIPNKAKSPAPVFLALNSAGNHTVCDFPGLIIDEKAWRGPGATKNWKGGEGRGADANFWCVEQLIDRGYAFATFHESDIDPDKHDFTDGIHPFYPNLPGPRESAWGTIAAWAWGLHRAVDYLATDSQVNPAQICLTGHSRRGKTALLAAAFDERIALVVPHQSGTGGCAMSRNNDQETVERINRVFPHWFNDQFVAFGGHESRLPIDQHLLIAMVAPRPLLETAGLKDKWANYDSALLSLKGADPVYKLLGASGMVGGGVAMGPQPVTGSSFGTLMQYRRDDIHTLNSEFWTAILDFADGHLKRTPPAR